MLFGAQDVVLTVPDHYYGGTVTHFQFRQSVLDDQGFGAAKLASFIRTCNHIEVVVQIEVAQNR